MTEPTTYGELVRGTAAQVALGAAMVAGRPFASRAEAARALASYRDLAHALARVGTELLGPARLGGLRAGASPDPVDAAMLRLVDDLGWLGRERPFDKPVPDSGAGGAWARAARTAGTAADLLATHQGPAGEQRTPNPTLDQPGVRMAGYGEFAGLAGSLTDAAPLLGRRAVDAGLERKRLTVVLAHARTALASADQVRGLARVGDFAGPDALEGLAIARPAVRLGDPLVEFDDRITRLHRTAWQLTQTAHVGVATLADYATLGALVNQAAGATLARLSLDPQAVAEHAQRWRQVRYELRVFRTATPVMLGVRADGHAVRDLLRGLADPRSSSPSAQALPVLLAASRAFEDVARWNDATLSHLFAAGDLYLVGAALPRDFASTNPGLASAKLRDRLTQAPDAVIRTLSTAYESLRNPDPARAVPMDLSAPSPATGRQRG